MTFSVPPALGPSHRSLANGHHVVESRMCKWKNRTLAKGARGGTQRASRCEWSGASRSRRRSALLQIGPSAAAGEYDLLKAQHVRSVFRSITTGVMTSAGLERAVQPPTRMAICRSAERLPGSGWRHSIHSEKLVGCRTLAPFARVRFFHLHIRLSTTWCPFASDRWDGPSAGHTESHTTDL